jgi:DNA repair protein RAD16
MKHFAWWNRNVMNPILKHGMASANSEKAMKILKYILQQVMLRRTKTEKAQDLCLPPRVIRVRRDQLDEEENDFYDALYTQSKTSFDTFVAEGSILHNYAHVFDLLLRLRQAVDHPYLVLHSKEREDDTNNEWCSLCRELAEDPIISKCKHVFCRTCIAEYTEMSKEKTGCPVCFVPLTIDLNQKSLVNSQVLIPF